MSEYDRIGERQMDHGISRWYIANPGPFGRPERTYTHQDCERRARSAREAFGRWFSRAVSTRTTWNEPDMNEYQLEQLRWLLDGMQEYVESASRYLDELEGKDRRAERIAALRNVAGRTPAEAVAFLSKADQLEKEAAHG